MPEKKDVLDAKERGTRMGALVIGQVRAGTCEHECKLNKPGPQIDEEEVITNSGIVRRTPPLELAYSTKKTNPAPTAMGQ